MYRLALLGLFVLFSAPNVSAQVSCGTPPEGLTIDPDPVTTAKQVESGEATLKEFMRASLDKYRALHQDVPTIAASLYFQCLTRQSDSAWRSGSTYLVFLTPDGRIFQHARSMGLSGRMLKPEIYTAVLQALEVDPGELVDFQSMFAALAVAASKEGGYFDAGGAAGYTVVQYGEEQEIFPYIWIAGLDIGEEHLVPFADETVDPGNPSVTAKDVVDRATLKEFVSEAGRIILSLPGLNALSQFRVALRDPNGPWRHGSVYLYILNSSSKIILFHGAFPDRFEFRPLVPTVRDAVTGEFILNQVLQAANVSPEGGFVEYYFDDPTDATDRADIPKIGYARKFRLRPQTIIIGSGFYLSESDFASLTRTEVEATIFGDIAEGAAIEFSRAIAGQPANYLWNAFVDTNSQISLSISSTRGVTGYYRARAIMRNEVVGLWNSIPMNSGRRQTMELFTNGSSRVIRVESLSRSNPVVAAKPATSIEGGLSPGSPNPFNSSTILAYRLENPGPVRLVIYNVLGQPVRTLVDVVHGAGTHRIAWDARNEMGALLSTGIYFARLSYPGGVQTQRLLFLK